MAFFSDIVNEARRNAACQPVPTAAAPKPAPVTPVTAAPETPAPVAPVPFPSPVPAAAPVPTPDPVSAPAPGRPPEPKPPAIDLTHEAPASDGDAERKDHEAAEAKRKAEWDAKQAEKKAARQAALGRIAAMNGAELLAAATDRVATDTERLTRRNMKEAVAGHVQAKCREDAAFAMLVMDPDKSMVHCFQYISRQAQAYAEQEMKDQGIQRTGVYGLDVPDGLCYQWAEDYFRDPEAKEDHANEEKFVPKPYVPAPASRKTPKDKAKKPEKPKAEKPKAEKPKGGPVMEQISLM